MTKPDRGRLELVLLARLAIKTKKPPSKGELVRAVRPFVEHALGSGETTEQIERALSSLEDRGEITAKPHALTDDGRSRLLEFLGLERLPSQLTWKQMRRKYLVARTLDLKADRLKDADRLRGLVIRKHHDLPTSETSTLIRAIDSLVWRQLGVESDKPLTLNEVRAHMLRNLLGTESKLGLEKIVRVLAANAAGASSPDDDAIRLALVRSWLCASQDERRFDLDRFAEDVRRAAARTEQGRFGDDRVFIAAVWRTLGSALPLEEFKERLVVANRAGLVRLTRADLVEAMDPAEVSASATHYLNATFHFVEAEARGAS